jgi:hypothetical protein
LMGLNDGVDLERPNLLLNWFPLALYDQNKHSF